MEMYNSKIIFTFWEPKDKIPAYLQLCMKTWKKFLPNYDIVTVDYTNLHDYLGEDFYDEILYKNFSLPKQADAIRCALLNKYGGIWLDLDTIFLNNNIANIITSVQNDSEVEVALYKYFICFIIAKKGADFLSNWENEIITKLDYYKKFYQNPFNKLLQRSTHKELKKYDYFGNSIVNKLIKEKSLKYRDLSSEIMNPIVEYSCIPNDKMNAVEKYQLFYFNSNIAEMAENRSNSVLFLHNSWTPHKYKLMSEKEFLSEENTISNILRKILEE